MSDDPISLNRELVVAAIADYLLQINHRGYAPDRRKVLAVRRSDRTASLRNAATPVRWEVYYFIEGELIPEQGATRLAAGQSHVELAEKLVARIWDQLWVWNGYDFTPTSYGLNVGKYSDEQGLPLQRGDRSRGHGHEHAG